MKEDGGYRYYDIRTNKPYTGVVEDFGFKGWGLVSKDGKSIRKYSEDELRTKLGYIKNGWKHGMWTSWFDITDGKGSGIKEKGNWDYGNKDGVWVGYRMIKSERIETTELKKIRKTDRAKIDVYTRVKHFEISYNDGEIISEKWWNSKGDLVDSFEDSDPDYVDKEEEAPRRLTRLATSGDSNYVGTWYDSRPLMAGHIRISKSGSNFTIQLDFNDGSKWTSNLTEQIHFDSFGSKFKRFDMSPSNTSGDHWIINRNGDLECHDNDGLVYTARRR